MINLKKIPPRQYNLFAIKLPNVKDSEKILKHLGKAKIIYKGKIADLSTQAKKRVKRTQASTFALNIIPCLITI